MYPNDPSDEVGLFLYPRNGTMRRPSLMLMLNHEGTCKSTEGFVRQLPCHSFIIHEDLQSRLPEFLANKRYSHVAEPPQRTEAYVHANSSSCCRRPTVQPVLHWSGGPFAPTGHCSGSKCPGPQQELTRSFRDNDLLESRDMYKSSAKSLQDAETLLTSLIK